MRLELWLLTTFIPTRKRSQSCARAKWFPSVSRFQLVFLPKIEIFSKFSAFGLRFGWSLRPLTLATRANIDGTNLARWVKNSWMREGLPVNVGKEKNTKKPFSPALVVAKQKYDDTWWKFSFTTQLIYLCSFSSTLTRQSCWFKCVWLTKLSKGRFCARIYGFTNAFGNQLQICCENDVVECRVWVGRALAVKHFKLRSSSWRDFAETLFGFPICEQRDRRTSQVDVSLRLFGSLWG